MKTKLQEIRKDRGYASTAQFAEALGVSYSTYTHWEQDDREIPLKNAVQCADLLGCTLDELVYGVEDRRPALQRRIEALPVLDQRTVSDMVDFLEARRRMEYERQVKAENEILCRRCRLLLDEYRREWDPQSTQEEVEGFEGYVRARAEKRVRAQKADVHDAVNEYLAKAQREGHDASEIMQMLMDLDRLSEAEEEAVQADVDNMMACYFEVTEAQDSEAFNYYYANFMQDYAD